MHFELMEPKEVFTVFVVSSYYVLRI